MEYLKPIFGIKKNIMKKNNSLMLSDSGRNLVGQEMFKILDKAKIHEENGKRIIHLELGQPRFETPNNLINFTKNSLDKKRVGYCSSYGLIDLRLSISHKLNKKYSVNVENIIISSANLLISQVMHLLCNPDDNVVIFTPAFPTYIASSIFLNVKLHQIKLDFNDGFILTKKHVDQALNLSPKLIIINSANNPTGAVYSKESINYLYKMAKRKKIWILSDETYGEIVYQSSFHSFLEFKLDNLIVISSFSKIYSIPGYRTGFAVSNKEIIDKLSLSNSTLISCQPIFIQEGISKVMKNDKSYLSNINKTFLKVVKKTVSILNSSKFIKGNYTIPVAGYYMLIKIDDTGLSDIEFCEKLLDNHFVAVTPGSCFGDGFSSFIRISLCGDFDSVIKGIKKIIKFYEIQLRLK